jgi:hypothetical protein
MNMRGAAAGGRERTGAVLSLPVPTDPPPPDGVLRWLGLEGCVRVPLRVDAARLADEISRLPEGVWGQASRDPVVQAAVESSLPSATRGDRGRSRPTIGRSLRSCHI